MVILLKNQKKIVEKLLKNQMKIQQTIAPLQNQTIYQQITLIVKKLRRNLMEKLQTNQGQVRARKLHQMISKRAIQYLSHQMMTEMQQPSQFSPWKWAGAREALVVRIPVWTVTQRLMNTVQTKQFPTHPWSPQKRMRMQHWFPTAQKLHLTMMQSPEHRQTVRAVTIPAFMVQVQQSLPQTELLMSKTVR